MTTPTMTDLDKLMTEWRSLQRDHQAAMATWCDARDAERSARAERDEAWVRMREAEAAYQAARDADAAQRPYDPTPRPLREAS